MAGGLLMQSMDPDLLRAAQAGDPGLVDEIVRRQVELLPAVFVDNLHALAGVSTDGDTVLHIAVREGHLELTKVLCSLYLTLALVQNDAGDTPLHCAARAGSVDMILLLVAYAKKPISRDFRGAEGLARHLLMMTNNYRNTALHEAVLEGHDDAAVLLLNLEPELSSPVNYAIQSPLYLAAEKKLMGITRALLLCPFTSMDAPGGQSVLFNILGWDSKEHRTHLRRAASLLMAPRDVGLSSSPTINRQLLAAARSGNTEALQELLRGSDEEEEEGPHPLRCVTGRRSTALHLAASHGRLEFAKQICRLDRKFLIAVQNARGDTPLHCAARAGHHEIVSHLINVSKEFAASGSPDVRELQMLAVLRARNMDGDTALHEAARNGDMAVALKLVQAFPALSSFTNAAGVSPLYLAIERGSREMARCLLKSIPYGETYRDNRTYVPRVSHAGPYGQTTLHVAVDRSTGITKMLLKAEPDLAISKDCHGSTPLHYVAASGNIKVTRLLLEARASAAYMQDEDGFAPIHIAARMGHINIIKELVDHCPDCGDLVDNEGRTFLHLAITKKSADLVKYVIEMPGLEHLLNARDIGGNTPLHAAAMCDNEKIVRLLAIDKRIEKSSMNNQGCTPLDLALQAMNSISGLQLYRITKHLQSAGSRVSPYGHNNSIDSYRNQKDEVQSQRALVNNLALVAVLIATVSFAAAFTLPGGYNENAGADQGAALLAKSLAFKVFLLADTVAMVSSITVACILIYTALQTPNAKPQLLQVALNIFWIALIGMVVAFGMGAYTVVELDSRWLAVLIVIMSCSVPVVIWQLTSWGPHDVMIQLWEIHMVLEKIEITDFA